MPVSLRQATAPEAQRVLRRALELNEDRQTRWEPWACCGGQDS